MTSDRRTIVFWLIPLAFSTPSWAGLWDDVATVPGASLNAMAETSDGSLLVAGYLKDTQDTWATYLINPEEGEFKRVDTYSLAPNQPAVPWGGVVVAPNGAAIVAGRATDATGVLHCVVRRSPANFAGWTTALDLPNTTCSGVALERGRLHVAATVTLGGAHAWLIKDSSDLGATWNDEKPFQLIPGKDSALSNIFVNPMGGLFAVGTGLAADGTRLWVTASSDPEGKLKTLETYPYGQGGPTVPTAGTVDSSGRIWVVGYGVFNTASEHRSDILVRRSSDQGATWQPLLQDVQTNSVQVPASIQVALDGKAYVSSWSSINADGLQHWIVKQSQDDGRSWNNADNYLGQDQGGAGAFSICESTLGDLFVSGWATTSADGDRDAGKIRRLVP